LETPTQSDYIVVADVLAGEGQGAGRRDLRHLQADGAQHLGIRAPFSRLPGIKSIIRPPLISSPSYIFLA
jgi:hypothetical protein